MYQKMLSSFIDYPQTNKDKIREISYNAPSRNDFIKF